MIRTSGLAASVGHKGLLQWVDEAARLCRPDSVVWIDGSEEERKRLEEAAVASGELLRLNPGKLPGCFYHRSHPSDVARTENLTFICTKASGDAGPTNNWMAPDEGYRRAGEILAGSMKGRTMYVIPFCMGPIGSPFGKIGVQVTDSLYVVLNMRIMTRVGAAVLERLGPDGEFTRCLHGKADLDPKRRLILHFPEDNAVWSVGSGYGGNALLGKKCLALRIAGWQARNEGWMAEHMLILGVERPGEPVRYIAAAFPSACGKTNLAMLVPPDSYRRRGWRVWTIGEDIAWMRPGPDGGLWAVNPEAGCFGVVPGTNSRTNPNAIRMIGRNTIFTNTALLPDGTVWWEGADGAPPSKALDWQGREWRPGMTDSAGNPVRAAHPNSRFTVPASQCPSIAPNWEDPAGVPISAILFGGRRPSLEPLVYETFNWNHGVYAGATLASERTAAAEGAVGELRRDPMAMLPFCGYHMGDYFGHWLDMGRRLKRPPKIFHVNWFRTDGTGAFLWPGFGENLRVLDWVLRRCEEKTAAERTQIGLLPDAADLDLSGLNLPPERVRLLLSVDREAWRKEQEDHARFFELFGDRLPAEIRAENRALKDRLA